MARWQLAAGRAGDPARSTCGPAAPGGSPGRCKLAAWLRLLGFDTLCRNDFTDAEVAAIAEREARIVLTRDRRLLHQKRIGTGYCGGCSGARRVSR